MIAGNDLNAGTLTSTDRVVSHYHRRHNQESGEQRDDTVHGTGFTSGGETVLHAGHDATLTAARVESTLGGIRVSADHDVNLLAAQEEHDTTQDIRKKQQGALTSRRTRSHDATQDSQAITGMLSGEQVQVVAGHDINSQGEQIVGSGHVALRAGHDLDIASATNTHSEEHDRTTRMCHRG